MKVFNYNQPEELLTFLKNFNKAIGGTGTTKVMGRINYLRNLLCGEALRKFDELMSQNTCTTNMHLKVI